MADGLTEIALEEDRRGALDFSTAPDGARRGGEPSGGRYRQPAGVGGVQAPPRPLASLHPGVDSSPFEEPSYETVEKGIPGPWNDKDWENDNNKPKEKK